MDSQPFINNIPAGNLLLSSAILLTGSLPEQSLRVLRTVGCASITSRTYFNHQRWFLFPAIYKTWNMYHEALVAMLQSDNSTLVLGGDGRADSPGHSAKYGKYTLMELSHNIILDIQLVQVIITLHNFNLFLFIQSNEVGGSYYMELEGLKRGIMELEQYGLTIGTLVTDWNAQIAKWVRNELPSTIHLFDVWHLAIG